MRNDGRLLAWTGALLLLLLLALLITVELGLVGCVATVLTVWLEHKSDDEVADWRCC